MAPSRLLWSPAGFFHRDVHRVIPVDAVPVSAAVHARLLDGQARGKEIVAGPGGRPILADPGTRSPEERRQRARRQLRRETRRRILAIASLETQANDNSALALAAFAIASAGATTIDTAAAIGRRTRIDAIRAAGAAIGAVLEQVADSDLATFDPTADHHWPDED
jgi:hypothetical protein